MVINANQIILLSMLKDCAINKDIRRGSRLHSHIMHRGLLGNSPSLGSALINMYAKCGVLSKAKKILEEISIRNVICWNALINGYAQEGLIEAAIGCFRKLQSEGLSPDAVTFICILKACGKAKAIDHGKRIHDEIIHKGLLEKDIILGNTLVDMYAKCGSLAKAKKVLERLPVRNVVSWNAIITGHVQQGQVHGALNCFEQMQREGFSPDAVTFISVLQACGKTRSIEMGKQIHDAATIKGLLEKDILLGNALVDMYVKCGKLIKAQDVLKGLPYRTVASWNALISGHAEQGQVNEAMVCLEKMQLEGVAPDAVTFICILKACGKGGALDKGIQIHYDILDRGLLEKDIVLGNTLVDMYAKCGALEKAQETLEGLPIQDVVSWNALISGYEHQGKGHEALRCVELMRREGFSPDAVTFICILKACGRTRDIGKGTQTHEEIMSLGLLEKDIVLGGALVDMYAKCDMLVKAQSVLRDLPVRNAVSWCALICGYVKQGQHDEALTCFEQMCDEGLYPDVVTFICILKACGIAGAVDKGKEIHEAIMDKGLMNKDIVLANTVVDMYTKCGVPEKAQAVLEELCDRDVVSWNTLITGYAQQGHGREALNCFKQMLAEGVHPSEITFSGVLSACSHSGLLDEARMVFGDMIRKYDVIPDVEHHICMIVIFGRAGLFDEAVSVIQVMPSAGHRAVWLALLGACRKWGNVKLGRVAFDQLLQLDCSCVAAYVLMSNIFAAAGMQEDADNVEAMRLKYAAWKKQGRSVWIDGSGNVHLFSFGDRTHHQREDIYARIKTIELRMLQEGHSLTGRSLLESTLNDGKNVSFAESEYLAIACALINMDQEETIHILNDVCVPEDLCIAVSHISRIVKRKIMIRDPDSLRVFEHGKYT